MIFVTLISIRPGKFEEAVKAFRELKAPQEIKTIAFYGLFGRIDGVLIFEAPDEATAMNFIAGVQDIVQTETFLAIQPQAIGT